MALMQITFSGRNDEFEYDIDGETNTIMFHDKNTSSIFLGKGEMNAECKNDIIGIWSDGIVAKPRPVDITISLRPYSIFKYNDSQFDGRFAVYWNERDTVIWDKERKRQVPNKDIWSYLHPKIKDDDDWDDDDWE